MIPECISIIISLVALLISITERLRTQADTVKEFFFKFDSKEEKENRRVVYMYRKEIKDDKAYVDYLKEHPTELSQSIALFDYWARLVKHHYLPFWAFKGMSGQVAVNFYNVAKPYIKFRQDEGYSDILEEGCKNKNFASNYEWLVKKIESKNYQYKK